MTTRKKGKAGARRGVRIRLNSVSESPKRTKKIELIYNAGDAAEIVRFGEGLDHLLHQVMNGSGRVARAKRPHKGASLLLRKSNPLGRRRSRIATFFP